jgi:hypothetical protein
MTSRDTSSLEAPKPRFVASIDDVDCVCAESETNQHDNDAYKGDSCKHCLAPVPRLSVSVAIRPI